MLSLPPSTPNDLTPSETIAKWLQPLVGLSFHLTGKSRTDGSSARKLVAECLEKHYDSLPKYIQEPVVAVKGVPKIQRELLDTYIVTSGSNYNLQIWNRIPASDDILIDYGNLGCLRCSDVRLVFIRINPETDRIESIIVASPNEIENRFGKFGVPTIKWQLIISDSKRQSIIENNPPVLIEPDLLPEDILGESVSYHSVDLSDAPEAGKIAPIHSLAPILVDTLLGKVIEPAATKNRGQQLEYSVISLLDYDVDEESTLVGGYPDLPNQALEIKIQDSPTVDLGKYSPQFKTEIFPDLSIDTQNMRYLIALMDKETNTVEGLVLLPGKNLGDHFTYVADKNYKCQRSIPMSFFEEYRGMSLSVG